MILKPSNMLPDNSTYPKSEVIEISWKNNGDIMVAFTVIVENNSTGLQAFSSGKISSYTQKYQIPANSLVDGVVYRYKIIVYNSVNETAISDYKIIKCYTRPVNIIQTDGTMRNQIASFSTTYSQAQNIELKSYKYILFDEYDNVLEDSEYLYDGLLSYTFNYRLIDDTQYKVECITITQNDLLGTSGRVSFIADYIPPSVYFNLQAESYIDNPYVKLLWTTVRIIGETEGAVSYINNTKLDTMAGKVYFDRGFTLNKDFTIRLWIDSVQNDSDVVGIMGDNGNIVIKYYDNKFHAYKTIAGYTTHIATNEIGSITGQLYVCLQQIGKYLNIFCEVI